MTLRGKRKFRVSRQEWSPDPLYLTTVAESLHSLRYTGYPFKQLKYSLGLRLYYTELQCVTFHREWMVG
jgi:hypothetical protein